MKHLFAFASLALLVAGCGSNEHDVSTLQDGLWVLSAGRDVPLPAGVVPTAGFHERVVRGSTGCNQYSGAYTVDGGSLDIGDLSTTRMACATPRDEVERDYVRALGLVTTWAIDGDELVLSDGSGEELLRYTQARTGGDI